MFQINQFQQTLIFPVIFGQIDHCEYLPTDVSHVTVTALLWTLFRFVWFWLEVWGSPAVRVCMCVPRTLSWKVHDNTQNCLKFPRIAPKNPESYLLEYWRGLFLGHSWTWWTFSCRGPSFGLICLPPHIMSHKICLDFLLLLRKLNTTAVSNTQLSVSPKLRTIIGKRKQRHSLKTYLFQWVVMSGVLCPHPGISAPRSNSKSGKIYFLDTRKQALDKGLVRKSSILVSFFLRNVLSQEGDFQRGAILKFHSKRFEISNFVATSSKFNLGIPEKIHFPPIING